MKTLPVELASMLEAAEPYARDYFRIAKDHKHIYMTLNKAASDQLRPIFEYYLAQKDFDSALEFLNTYFPDCIEKTLLLVNLHKAKDNFNKT